MFSILFLLLAMASKKGLNSTVREWLETFRTENAGPEEYRKQLQIDSNVSSDERLR